MSPASPTYTSSRAFEVVAVCIAACSGMDSRNVTGDVSYKWTSVILASVMYTRNENPNDRNENLKVFREKVKDIGSFLDFKAAIRNRSEVFDCSTHWVDPESSGMCRQKGYETAQGKRSNEKALQTSLNK